MNVTITQYLEREYEGAEVLYKRLSEIKTLGPDQKKAILRMVEAQTEIIDHLDENCSTPAEERKLSFIIRVITAARRLASE